MTVKGRRVLVTGATGRVGAEVAAALGREPDAKVRLLVRDRSRIPGSAAEVVVGDLDDRSSVRAAMRDVHTVFLATPDHPAQRQREVAAIEDAAAGGVSRIVKLSAQSAGLRPPRSVGRRHRPCEEALIASGLRWTILRPTFFMQSLLLFAPDVARRRTFVAPVRHGRTAMVDTGDVGAAAAAVLRDDSCRHDGAIHELTGPEPVAFPDVARALTTELGVPVRFLSLPRPVARVVLPRAAHLPRWLAADVIDLLAAIDAGLQEATTPAVTELTGHAPTPLAAFLARDRGAFETVTP